MKQYLLLATLLLAPWLGGCAAVMVGGAATAGAMHDRRSFGTVIDDQTLQIAAIDRIYQERARFAGTRIKAVAHNGVVLLIGEVLDETMKMRAEQRVAELQGVRRVVNELSLGAPPGLWRRSADSALTARLKAGLLRINLPDFDASRVNVTTARGEVYLMGLLRRSEAEAVVKKIRRTSGVRRVINVFEYLD